jgi:uncharacterized protein YndB with AHSA1/START domain
MDREGEIRESRIIACPSKQVYRALTDAHLIALWTSFWARGALSSIQVEARPGGRFEACAGSAEGTTCFLRGNFLAVADDRLVATCEIPRLLGPLPHFEIRLRPEGERTVVLLAVTGVRSRVAFRRLQRGWRRILDMMEHGMPLLPAAQEDA